MCNISFVAKILFVFYHLCLLLFDSITCVFCFSILSSVSFAFRFYHVSFAFLFYHQCLLLSDSITCVFCFLILSCVFCFPILSAVSFAFLFYHLCLLLLQTPDRAKLATPLCCTIIIVFMQN